MNKLFIILLYILIYFVRFNQGGFKFDVELFGDTRSWMDQKITSFLPSPQAELLSGILLGQNKDLPGQLRLALRDTSTLHIVVASGQNLTMVAGFFLLLAGFVKRKVAMILGFTAIIFYILLTGAQIPILRAGLMVGFAFLANLIGREKDSIWVLLITAGIMLIINPGWLFDLSFQLSILATTGVVIVAPIFLKKLQNLPGFISSDLAVSLGAQIMVFPVIASNFHQLSLVAIPANLLVLWTIPFIMIIGAFFLAFFWIPILGWFVAQVLNILLTYFIYVVQFFSSLPFAWEYVGDFHWIVWIGYYLIVVAILKFIYETNP